jgi:biotin carboxyl carrier protein
MRYFCTLPGSAAPIEIEVEVQPRPGGYQVQVGKARHEVDLTPLPDGGFSLLVDGRSYDCAFEPALGTVVVAGRRFAALAQDERAFRLQMGAAKAQAEGIQTVRAPMPGKVVKVLVRAGEQVQAGQGLVVVEAMKMENELKSPRAGTVAEIWAREGAAVERNAPLVAVE